MKKFVIMKSFKVKTNQNKFIVEYSYKFAKKEEIKTNKTLFSEMCKQGCKNYNKKYCCPPVAPGFESLAKNYDGLFVMLFLCRLNQIKSTEYNKLRIANSVMKSKVERLMRDLRERFNLSYFGTGSCRLCRPCRYELGEPCRYPNKKRYSLEAVGINCNKLILDLFKIPLLWYKNKKSPAYTCVVCGLVCNEKDIEKIKKNTEIAISKF